MADQPQDNLEPDKQKKDVPQPVQLALEALKILEAEDAALAEESRKKLPGFALRLAASGEEVTVDGLLARARAREIDRVPEPQQQTKTYEEIVTGFYPEGESPTWFFAPVNKYNFERECAFEEVYDLPTAAYRGRLDKVKYLMEKFDRETTRVLHSTLNMAAMQGHLDVVRYLIESRDFDMDSPELLSSAVSGGNLALIKYLVEERGYKNKITAVIARQILHMAVASGHVGVMEYLQKLIKTRYGVGHQAFGHAAASGRLDMLKYCVNNDLLAPEHKDFILEGGLCSSAERGKLDVVKYIVEECGFTLHDDRADKALQAVLNSRSWPISEEQLNVGRYLITEHGASLERAPPAQKNRAEMADYMAGYEAWQRVARMDPPKGLYTYDPLYYKPKTMESVQSMLGREGYSTSSIAFQASALFGTESRVLQYLEKWGAAGKQPLHNLVYKIKLPKKKTPGMDLKAWGDAMLKCGPSMGAFVKFADRMHVPEKSDDGNTWSMRNTREKVAEFAYERAKENVELSAICIEHNVDEEDFNKALEISKQAPAVKNIPDIAIEGEAFGLPGATFHRLAANDMRGLFLGEMTDCCQSIGSAGAKCAEHGFTSENGGFYVVENAKGRVVGQAWAWRGGKGELVFDSLETLGENVKPEQWQKLTKTFARILAKKPADVSALHIGMGGATPRSLAKAFNHAASPAQPLDYNGYRDSRSQVVIWCKQEGLNG